MNEDAKTALLAQWKARIEAAGKGFPTDVDLLELMDLAASAAAAAARELQKEDYDRWR